LEAKRYFRTHLEFYCSTGVQVKIDGCIGREKERQLEQSGAFMLEFKPIHGEVTEWLKVAPC
jgi:hypothetical protein